MDGGDDNNAITLMIFMMMMLSLLWMMILCGWVGIAQFGTFPATFALVPLDNSPEETMEDAKQTTIKMKYLSDILFLLSMF